jgi:hypothetical protein
MYTDIVISLRRSSTNCGAATLSTGMTRKTRSPICNGSKPSTTRLVISFPLIPFSSASTLVASQYHLLIDITLVFYHLDRIGIPPSIDGRCSATGRGVARHFDNSISVDSTNWKTGKHVVVTLAFVYLLLICSFWFHPRDPIPVRGCIFVSAQRICRLARRVINADFKRRHKCLSTCASEMNFGLCKETT